MPTSLNSHKQKLAVQLQTLTSGFNRHLTVANGQRFLDRSAMREGLVSNLWQSWCRFLRSIIITSATGGTSASGTTITCAYAGLNELELMYVAKQISIGANITKVKPIAGPHQEPTWGDIAKAISISGGLGLSNSGQLLTALSLASSIPDLQTCRNATAHFGISQLNQLKVARVRYIDTRISHPTDACTWIDPATDGYLWDTWVDEMGLIADYACK